VFADLRARLTPLVGRAAAAAPAELPEREWDEDGQMGIAREIAEMVGFDMASGVIARSAHPFTGGGHRGDVRFTTRLDPASPLSSISAVMHELGHALYEQGFPASADRTPVHDAPSLGAHESQSRFWENQIGRTPAFWERIEPAMRRHFPEAMSGIDASLLCRASRVVRPSLIRVEADEVTYNLHIVLRFELELALIEGTLAVDDLPAAWDEGMHRLLGVEVPDAAQGVLQDVHWGAGLFGYFPTYTLGNLIAAQLWTRVREDLPEIDAQLASGELAPLRGWLREHIHRHGRKFPPRELLERATGDTLRPEPFLDYLRAKLRDAGAL
jgi:carboxypeptidase Taq